MLSACGMIGWDFLDPEVSTYENFFDLAVSLKLSPSQLDQLFKMMVFNVVFFNTDDRLKKHSFLYDPSSDRWRLSPAYYLTYSLNPLLRVTKTSRALSINQKRSDINLQNILSLAERYSIKHALRTLSIVQLKSWAELARRLGVEENVIAGIRRDFKVLISSN